MLKTFIDPQEQSVTIPKFKFDLTKLVDLLERPTVTAVRSAKILNYQVLNCIFDAVTDLLCREMPFALEEAARAAIKVQSVKLIPAELVLDETPLRRVEKKRERSPLRGGKGKKDEDRDLDYHMSFKRFQQSLASINGFIIEKHKQLEHNRRSVSPSKVGKIALSADKDKTTAERERENATKRNSGPRAPSVITTSPTTEGMSDERVYNDPLAAVSAFLEMGYALNCLGPLDKELHPRMVENMHFGRSYVHHYYSKAAHGNNAHNCYHGVVKEFVKDNFF